MLVGDRLGAVIDQEEKRGRQQAKSEETQQKSDHGDTNADAAGAGFQALPFLARLFNAAWLHRVLK
jgi:hypothetical protein